MKRKHACGAFVVLSFLLVLVSSPRAQERSHRARVGFPQDWAQRQLLFNRAALLKHPRLINQEPRIAQQALYAMGCPPDTGWRQGGFRRDRLYLR